MFLVILVTLIIVFLITKKYMHDKKYADFYSIHGPKTLPLIGNALMFRSTPSEIFHMQMQLAKKYDHFYRLVMGPEKVVVLSNPEHVEVVLRSMKHLDKAPSYSLFANFLRNGLINSGGTHWQKHRKILSPTFHFNTLDSYATFMCKNLKVMLKILETQTSKVIQINPFVNLFTLDSICESAMRFNMNAQLNVEGGYVKALKGYLVIHMKRIFSIFLRIPIIFKLSRWEKAQMVHVNYMSSFAASVIATRKKERLEKLSDASKRNKEEFEKEPQSFLDRLLDHQDVLDDDEIEDEVNTFLFAGHDTVASSISFCLYELAGHPEVQEKLVEESWDVMGKNADVEVNWGNVNTLKYLDIAIKECMRKHTTVPFIERVLGEDTVINEKLIPKGTTIQMNLYAIHHNEKYFPEPEKFDPERFAGDNASRNAYAYIPFSAGPRNCVGFKYGILMTKACVINVLRNFVLRRSPDAAHEPKLFNNAILESVTGVNVILEKRII